MPDFGDFAVIYPRAWIEVVVVYDDGDTVTTGMAPSVVTVTKNPHHQADTCEAEVNLSAITFGHRAITSMFLTAFMGVVDRIDGQINTSDSRNVQFCGQVDVMRDHRSSKGPLVNLKARDQSALLRDRKLIATKDVKGVLLDPTPRYSDTIRSAINRILQWAQIPDSVLQVDDPYGLGSTSLAQSVSSRERNSCLPIRRDASAWDVIEQVGLLSGTLITVELGNIQIRPSHDLFGAKNGKPQPADYNFIFGYDGANALEVEREKKFIRNRRGVKVIAFDPKTRRSFSAVAPNDADLEPRHVAHPKHKNHKSLPTSHGPTVAVERDVYTFGLEGIATVEQAQALATRLYGERSRQEMEGSIVTRNWTPDLFKLRNGSRIGIRISQRLEHELRAINDETRKLDFLRTRLAIGTDEAKVLLKNAQREEENIPYYVRSIRHSWNTKTFQSHIDYTNLIVLG